MGQIAILGDMYASGGVTKTVDRALLVDATRCPACAARLQGPRCDACGVDLSGPEAARLWQVSGQAARLLDRRDELLDGLRRAAATSRPAVAPAAPGSAAPGAGAPSAGAPRPAAAPGAAAPGAAAPGAATPGAATPGAVRVTPPPPRLPGPAPAAPRDGGPGVHGLLVGLGALLLSVAAVGFLVFSWRVLSIGGRAAVIAGCTLGVLALATWLRPRLPETGEAVGALGAVLVVADAWAVRRTGLFGADQGPGLAYAAAAAAVCAVVLGAWAAVGRVRAGSVAASLLAPAAVVLAAAQAADANDSAAPFALGLVAAAALTTVRRALPAPWRLERVVLTAVAALALGVAAPIAALVLDDTAGALTLLLAGAVAAAQSLDATPSRANATNRRAWSAVAGSVTALAALPAARAVEAAGAGDEWLPGIAPALAAGVLLVAAALAAATTATTPRPAAFAAGAGAVTACFAVPAALGAVAKVLTVATLAGDPWRTAPGAALEAAVRVPTDLDGVSFAAVVLGLVAVTVAGTAGSVLVGRRSVTVARALRAALAAPAGVLLVLVAPLAPRLSIAGATVLEILAAVALGVAAHRLRDRTAARLLQAGCAATALLAVVLAWSTRPLSVPVTLLGVAALLLARRIVTTAELRAALGAAATAAALVAAGAVAGLAGQPSDARVAVAGAVGALLGAALVAVPALGRTAGPAWTPAERLAAAAVAGIAAAAGAVHALGTRFDADGAAWPAETALAALLAAALVIAAGLRRDVEDAADLRTAAAATVTALAAGLATVVADDVAAARDATVDLPIVAAATCAVVAVAHAVLVLTGRIRAAGTPRAAAELGTAVTGAAVLAVALAGDPDLLWLPLLFLGVAAAAVSGTPDRRRVGWVAGVLLTASSWARLWVADVGTVEAYTLPPAAALLAVAALRLRRDAASPSAADPARVLAPGAALALLPSVVASVDGPPLRPVALLLVAAGLAALAELARDRRAVLGGERLVPALLGTAVLTAAGVAVARGLVRFAAEAPAALPWTSVEPWSLAAAAVVAGAALVARGRPWAELPLAAAVLTAAVPSLVAAAIPPLTGVAAGAADPWRAAAAIAAGAVVAVAATLARPRLDGVTVAGLGVVAAGTVVGLALGTGPVEAWTLPLGAALAAVGAVHLARTDAGSWPALGPGLAAGLLPSLLLSAEDAGTPLRSAGLAVLAAAVVIAGARFRLQAPLVGGAVVLTAHAVVHAAPYVAAFYAEAGVWATLGTVGAVLLVVGASYERRLNQMRSVRLRLAALR